MEYAVDKGDNNGFVTNAKPLIASIPTLVQNMSNEANKNKNVKKIST
jgi:hypothetical protein